MENNYIIDTRNVSKSFEQEGFKQQVLRNINLKIKPGEFIAITGPSGSGKTTLLNVLGLLELPSSGQYFFFKKEVETLSNRAILQFRKNNIGFVFQNFNLIDELNIFENIELPLIYTGLPAPHRKIKVEQIMEKLNLAHKSMQYPPQLSGGMQQKVAIARAVVNSPKLILADEPTGNLDSVNGTQVMELLSALNKSGATILVATHSIKDAEYSRRLIKMLDGRIVAQSFGKENYTKYAKKNN